MHELSIAMRILDMADEESTRRSAAIGAIHVKIGALSGVAKEALLLAYDLARAGTALDSVQLVIDEVPVLIYCPHCRAPRGVRSIQQLTCMECDTPSSEILQGREFQVTALEVR